ncbi:MAG TPA: ATP-dependent RecD-like DNA helicase [Victivallales bacterium]|nr:ATP-dependent RecD-like DNA helicase [Victivallales bacterium]
MDNSTDSKLEKEEISGEIYKILYVNDDETYSVIKIRDGNNKSQTLTGPLGGAFEGQGIRAKGNWEEHPDYGPQFKVINFQFTLPATASGIEKYLASGLIPGIGSKRAKLIVSHFHEDTLNILNNYSARLLQIPGLGKKTVESIRTSWKEQAAKREIMIYFQSIGISLTYYQKIYKILGDHSLNIVKNNPYLLADKISGIGFSKADMIAENIGINHNDDKRLIAGVKYSLNQLAQSGHVCYPLNNFISYNAELLDIDLASSKNSIQLAKGKELISTESIISNDVNEEFIYDRQLYISEVVLSQIIKHLSAVSGHKGQFISKLKCKSGNKIKFNKEQLDAIDKCSVQALSIITGGPGVGKTTIIGEIIRRSLELKLKIAIAAPTGRAAKRIHESTNFAASTIHRLLKWDPINKTFVHNHKNKLEIDLLVVDEVSMLDLNLAYSLFKAVKNGTTVILVGDVDQLPSVGPGNVLSDIIKSNICPVTHLTNIYRQNSNSQIIPTAHSVNRGQMINLNNDKRDKYRDFYWIEQDDPEKVSKLILKMIVERIPNRFRFNPFRDIQILTPMIKGICGTTSLNEKLQSALNNLKIETVNCSNKFFKVGDKVMQIANNYDKNIFNGDIGYISEISIENKKIHVNFDSNIIEYEFFESDQLTLAYAITIHKSQGSEFPVVIIPFLTSHYIMLKRNLLYTAITRAKKLLIIVGSKKALQIAINNYQTALRHSGLLYRLNN